MTVSGAHRLEIRNLTVQFGSTTALNDVSISFKPGEIHAIIGENGAGKSTLMKVLAGAVKPTSGTILLDQKSFHPHHPKDAHTAGVSMIYQELSLIPHLSIEENLALDSPSGFISKFFLNRKKMRIRAHEAMGKIGRAELPLHIPVGSLTISTQQVVEIGRALASQCKVLILDEPTSSLSKSDIGNLFQLLKGLRAQGYTILYISHFLEEVKAIADRVTVMRDGKVAATVAADEKTTEELVTLMLGRNLQELYPRTPRNPGVSILELKTLNSNSGVRNVSLTLKKGEVLGIAGLMGSSRTETLRAIFGLDRVRSGEVRIGKFFGNYKPYARWKQGMGFLSEDRRSEGLSLNLTLAQNLTLSALKKLGRFGFISHQKQNQITTEWLKRMSVRCEGPSQKIGQLSGGNQQKIAFARLLNNECDVLLLDEPTRGIDVSTKAQIYSLIDQIAAQGKSVILVSSYFPELLGVCDRIAVMRRGVLSEAKPVSEYDEKKLILEVTGDRI